VQERYHAAAFSLMPSSDRLNCLRVTKKTLEGKPRLVLTRVAPIGLNLPKKKDKMYLYNMAA